eukprot:CAMPEP_0197889306 /NCGR_PEP_ID=MMETSP1439-20131203/24272_1 /TAXON_ID=66791 /ORGANISM="Gonyaulax spinifera, Strain CCMP409" /LENGTH=35 /DNA_ID= /DNA_START= /DNA_END= /DNA_ORIENTATION=
MPSSSMSLDEVKCGHPAPGAWYVGEAVCGMFAGQH